MASCTTLTVSETFSADELYASAISISPSSVGPGEDFTATVTVVNNNNVAARATIDYTLNGDPYGTRNIVIPANTTDTWDKTLTAPTTVGNKSLCAELVSEEPY